MLWPGRRCVTSPWIFPMGRSGGSIFVLIIAGCVLLLRYALRTNPGPSPIIARTHTSWHSMNVPTACCQGNSSIKIAAPPCFNQLI